MVDISAITDQQPVEYLCQNRAVIPCPRSDRDILSVECPVPLHAVVHQYLFSQECVVVCRFGHDSAPLAVMHIALIHDCLRGANRERLHAACGRPSWTVASDEFYAGHCFTSFGKNSPTPTWSLLAWPCAINYASPPLKNSTLRAYTSSMAGGASPSSECHH